jgi:ankyrin repeat protein
MKRFLDTEPIDLTSSASDGSNMLHLALGTAVVHDSDKQHLISNAVSMLCAAGADVNARDSDGARPIHYCATTMNREAAEILLHHKAKINYTDSRGHTALNYLAEDDVPDVELVKFLIIKRGKLGKNARLRSLPRNANSRRLAVRKLLEVNGC